MTGSSHGQSRQIKGKEPNCYKVKLNFLCHFILFLTSFPYLFVLAYVTLTVCLNSASGQNLQRAKLQHTQ